MTRDELCEAGRQLYGNWGWQTRLAEALEVDGSTVRRWVSGTVPVPGPVAAAIRCFLERQQRRQRQGSPALGADEEGD